MFYVKSATVINNDIVERLEKQPLIFLQTFSEGRVMSVFSFYPHNKNLPQCRSSTPQEVLIYFKLSILILPNANRRCRDKHRAYAERVLYACVRVAGGIVRAARTVSR